MATELQYAMLKKIVSDENYSNRSSWISNIVKTPRDKGVFSSLLEAGLVSSNGEAITITQEGLDLLK